MTLTYTTPLLKCIGRIHKDPFSLINNWAKRGEGNIFCWQNLWFTLVLLGHRQLFQENSYIADILLQWFCDKTKPHPLHRRTCLTLTLESNLLRDISCTENFFLKHETILIDSFQWLCRSYFTFILFCGNTLILFLNNNSETLFLQLWWFFFDFFDFHYNLKCKL